MLKSGEVEMERQKNKVLEHERDLLQSKYRAVCELFLVSFIINVFFGITIVAMVE